MVGTCDYSRQILERSYVIYKMKETETSRERERERERESILRQINEKLTI